MRPSAPDASPSPALAVSPVWPCGLGRGRLPKLPVIHRWPLGPPVCVRAPRPRFFPAVCSVKAWVLGALQREPIPGSMPVPGAQVPPAVRHTPAPVLTQVWARGDSVALRICGALVLSTWPSQWHPGGGVSRPGCSHFPDREARGVWVAPLRSQVLRARETVPLSSRQELYDLYHASLVRSSPQVQSSPGELALAHRWAAQGLSTWPLYRTSWASPSVPLTPEELGSALGLRRTWGPTPPPHLGSHGLAVASGEL